MTSKTFAPSKEFTQLSQLKSEQYQELYQQSISDPDTFWAQQAEKYINWKKPWSSVRDFSFQKDDLHIEWFKGATLNVAENCLDRHLKIRGDKTAIIWQGDEHSDVRKISYVELHAEVCQFSNLLLKQGVKKGDRVTIYMPMIPEAAMAMLACARIGAIHSVVFGGFSPSALASRILDSDCEVLITADQGIRGGKYIPLKENADLALKKCPKVHTSIVVQHGKQKVQWQDGRDIWYHEQISTMPQEHIAEEMDSEDPLFILYTSGSTGAPKGVQHSSGGYLLQTCISHHYTFDLREDDVYWCTADVGWITGHSYIVYGPLANGATTLMFEGVPSYPDMSRFWQVVDQHQVSLFYTAPTAIRAIMAAGDQFVEATSRSSLRVLGTVGEPINPEAWQWYYDIVGQKRCPIVDTWWQTETGGHMLTPLPGVHALKPGLAMAPFFGAEPALLNDEGEEILDSPAKGNLVMKSAWPGMLRTVYGDHQRFYNTYFSSFPNYYFTGDGALRDEDGHYQITGRVDDVLNVSGHRLGTAECEAALCLHPEVAEAAVIGLPHEITGQALHAFVILMEDQKDPDKRFAEINKLLRTEIGPIAKLEQLHIVNGLPKTRSGKIMRRLLRKIAEGNFEQLGDTSTLADSSVLDELIQLFESS